MRVVVLAQEWPSDVARPLPSSQVSARVARAWTEVRPADDVRAFALGDGGPRTADAVEGTHRLVGGAEAVDVGDVTVLAPAAGERRWNPPALSAALLGLAADAARADTAPRTVVVPVGDEAPAGDASELWGSGRDAFAAGVAALPMRVLVSTDRPLLGFHGMSAAVRDGREADAAVAAAAQAQEDRWTAIARDADAHARASSLVPVGRLSDAPGTGAGVGLAYCLAAVGATLTPAAAYVADLVGAATAAEDADLVVAVVPAVTPRALGHGTAVAASALPGRIGVPCVAVAGGVHVGRRDLMNAGVAAAHDGAAGDAGLADAVRRVAQTWSR